MQEVHRRVRRSRRLNRDRFGICGEFGSGKTSAALGLLDSLGGTYCSFGEIYLALLDVLRQSVSDNEELPAAAIDLLRSRQVGLEAGPLESSVRYRKFWVTHSGKTVMPSKDAALSSLTRWLNSSPLVNEEVVRFVDEFTAREKGLVIMDGRQAWIPCPESTFFAASFKARVGRVQKRDGSNRAEATMIVREADRRDREMNRVARAALQTRIFDCTRLSREEVIRSLLLLMGVRNRD